MQKVNPVFLIEFLLVVGAFLALKNQPIVSAIFVLAMIVLYWAQKINETLQAIAKKD